MQSQKPQNVILTVSNRLSVLVLFLFAVSWLVGVVTPPLSLTYSNEHCISSAHPVDHCENLSLSDKSLNESSHYDCSATHCNSTGAISNIFSDATIALIPPSCDLSERYKSIKSYPPYIPPITSLFA